MSPTLKLRHLVLSNFGPFIGDHNLELPPNGLHMVLGENLDTDESSGAGKSSLVESLAYVFDYSTFAATELQSWEWLTKEPMSVEVNFDAPAGEVTLRRGKKAILAIAGKDSVIGAKAVKESMGQVVGVRPEILQALTYRPQGQPGLFLGMGDQEKKSFLTELLGLQVFETEVERVVKVITALEEDVKSKTAITEALQSQVPPYPAPLPPFDISELERTGLGLTAEIESVERNMKALKDADAKASLEQQQRERFVTAQWQPRIENLHVAIAELEGAILPLGTPERPEPSAELPGLKKKLELLRQGIAKAKQAHQEKLKQLRYQLQDERNSAHRLRNHAQGQSAVAEAERKRLVAEVAELEKMLCDRCHRPWSDAQHAAVLAEKRAGIESCNIVLASAEKELELANQSEHRAKELDLTLTFEQGTDPVPPRLTDGERDFAQRIADTEAAHKAAVANVERAHADRVRLLRAEKQTRVAEAQAQLSKAETDYMTALHQSREMTTEHVRLRENMSEAKELRDSLYADRRVVSERIEAAQRRQRDLDEQHKREQDAYDAAFNRYNKAASDLMDVATKLGQEQDYLGCIRSFLGVIFDETLDRIAHLTNERLARVPNVQGLTLRFVSERETKTTKNMRQEIRPIVERDGHEIPLKRTSGGQYTAVELAVDLSLADVIAERTGVMPGWLILDEAFNGLPVRSKTSCLELLKDASATRLILVIDHATEIKEMFDSVITVRSRDGRSEFV